MNLAIGSPLPQRSDRRTGPASARSPAKPPIGAICMSNRPFRAMSGCTAARSPRGAQSDGTNVGLNPPQTAAPNGGERTYWWRAATSIPRRLRASSTFPWSSAPPTSCPSDPINHHEVRSVRRLGHRARAFRSDQPIRTRGPRLRSMTSKATCCSATSLPSFRMTFSYSRAARAGVRSASATIGSKAR